MTVTKAIIVIDEPINFRSKISIEALLLLLLLRSWWRDYEIELATSS